MDKEELIDREQRLGRIAGIVGIAGVLMTLLPPILGLGSDFNQLAQDDYAQRMEAFELARDDILLSQIVQAVGLLLFAAPLTFLFNAASNRMPEMRRSLIGLCIVGPVFLAISLILYFAAYDSVASAFLDNAPSGTDANEAAKNALTDESTYSIFGGMQIAGLLALVVAVIYTSLQAMRSGLLTRFVGTLGMALGAGFVLIGPLSLAAWVLIVSPLIAGWWFGPRPPAWAAGEAIPWPKPGEAPPPKDEELADPDEFGNGDDSVVEGTATEKSESAGSDASSGPVKRKRKQR
jgi:hypothetical protein